MLSKSKKPAVTRPASPRRPLRNLNGAPPATPKRARARKVPGTNPLLGIKRLPYDVEHVRKTVKSRLKLAFDPEDWQCHLIYRRLEGYDSICIAGTGYGKSLIFEGLAAMQRDKVVIVISPLKALERDQVRAFLQDYHSSLNCRVHAKQARAKGLNEDKSCTEKVWRDVKAGKYCLVYVFPEMARCASFDRL